MAGKHNNWSLATLDGINLFNPNQIAKASGNADAFNVIISAIVSAVDKNGDLMRMAIASPGNDFRLGACEAPPAIVSTYLGDDLTKHLEQIMNGGSGAYTPTTKMLSSGISTIAPFEVSRISVMLQVFICHEAVSLTIFHTFLMCHFNKSCTVQVPTEDRNRTSPFPYGGHRYDAYNLLCQLLATACFLFQSLSTGTVIVMLKQRLYSTNKRRY